MISGRRNVLRTSRRNRTTKPEDTAKRIMKQKRYFRGIFIYLSPSNPWCKGGWPGTSEIYRSPCRPFLRVPHHAVVCQLTTTGLRISGNLFTHNDTGNGPFCNRHGTSCHGTHGLLHGFATANALYHVCSGLATGCLPAFPAAAPSSRPLKKGPAAQPWIVIRTKARGVEAYREDTPQRSATPVRIARRGCPKGCGSFRPELRSATLAVVSSYGSASRASFRSKIPRNAAWTLF